eukprot:TRINITY_DN11653_c0_g1_i1.p1 TRINITY_DN11653_c0_g1~~TRINITY_DN11653_c0_g1_i1.p1  ORF type:complete len:449 (+),score=105.85 TRINITY_DN11653_c0_g1_i1:27-1349(+)
MAEGRLLRYQQAVCIAVLCSIVLLSVGYIRFPLLEGATPRAAGIREKEPHTADSKTRALSESERFSERGGVSYSENGGAFESEDFESGGFSESVGFSESGGVSGVGEYDTLESGEGAVGWGRETDGVAVGGRYVVKERHFQCTPISTGCAPLYYNIGLDRTGSSSLAVSLPCHPRVKQYRAEVSLIDKHVKSAKLPTLSSIELASGVISGAKKPGVWKSPLKSLRQKYPTMLVFLTLRHPVEHALAAFWHGKTSSYSSDRILRSFCAQAGETIASVSGCSGAAPCGVDDACWAEAHKCVKQTSYRMPPSGTSVGSLRFLAIPAALHRITHEDGYEMGENFGIFFAEDYYRDPVEHIKRLYAWFGIDPLTVDASVEQCILDVGIVNENARANNDPHRGSIEQHDLPVELLRLLYGYAREFEREIAQYVEITDAWEELYLDV